MGKNKATKKQNQKSRLRKAKPWVATYSGSDVLRDYRKMFKVDHICAEKDLEAMGATTSEQREKLRSANEIRLQKRREERTASLVRKIEKRKTACYNTNLKPSDINKKNPKRRCENCGRAMKQQFVGLKHCKCGTSWSKSDGYFERTSDMVFALERKVTKNGKNSIKTKQVPIIRHNEQN